MKIIIWGAKGHMGEWVASRAPDDGDFEILGGFDSVSDPQNNICNNIRDLPTGADCVIDFSRPAALDQILEYALKNKCAVVLATTGYTDTQKKKIADAAKIIPILNSGNMSVGVNLMLTLVENAAKSLGEAFDIEIVEAHHHRKVDSPSGTADMLLRAAEKGRPDLDKVSYGRHAAIDQRSPHEVGMHSVRGGSIVGEHTVLFAGEDETIEIKHTALSRAIFANGALKAAKMLVKAKPALYTMKDVL